MAGESKRGEGEWLEVLAMQYGFDLLDKALATNKINEQEYLLLTDRVSKNRRRLVSLLGSDETMPPIHVIRDSRDLVIGKIGALKQGRFRACWFSKNAWGTAVLDSVKESERKIRLEIIRGLC